MNVKDFYSKLSYNNKECFDRIMEELSAEAAPANLAKLINKRDILKQKIETRQARREMLLAMKADIDILIEELEKSPPVGVELGLLLGVLRSRSVSLQDRIGKVIPYTDMRRKSKLTQAINRILACQEVAQKVLAEIHKTIDCQEENLQNYYTKTLEHSK